MRTLRKNPYILLEVMIALALVSLCIFPLISTQLYMYKSQKDLLETMQRDRTSNLILAHIYAQLYENTINWDMLQDEQPHEISAESIDGLKNKPFPYKIIYTMAPTRWKNNPEKIRAKSGKRERQTYHLFNLTITLQPLHDQRQSHSFSYVLFIERQEKEGKTTNSEIPLDDDEREEANQIEGEGG